VNGNEIKYHNRALLLPSVHNVWYPLMSRLRDMRTLLYMTTTASINNNSLQSLDEKSYSVGFGGNRLATIVTDNAVSQVTTNYSQNNYLPDDFSKLALSRKALYALSPLLVQTSVNCV
jgi:hypothetical protein